MYKTHTKIQTKTKTKSFRLNSKNRPVKLNSEPNSIKGYLNIGKEQNSLFELDSNLKLIKKDLKLYELNEKDSKHILQNLKKTEQLIIDKKLPRILPFSFSKDNNYIYMEKLNTDLNKFKKKLDIINFLDEIIELNKTLINLVVNNLYYCDIKPNNIFVKNMFKNKLDRKYKYYLGDIDSISEKGPFWYTFTTDKLYYLMNNSRDQSIFAINIMYYSLITSIFTIFLLHVENNKFFKTHIKDKENYKLIYKHGSIDFFNNALFIKNTKDTKYKQLLTYLINLIINYLKSEDGIMFKKNSDLVNGIRNINTNLIKLKKIYT